MSKYSLKAYIDTETVSSIYESGQKIVIVKKNDGPEANIAWVTFNPFEINNVTWESEYGLYASNTQMQSGAIINTASYKIASVKNIYPFSNGVFGSPVVDSSLNDNEYGIINKARDYEHLTFGLAQNVIANSVVYEGNPINAKSVLYNQISSFIPHEKICIFIESKFDNGAVITHIRSNSLCLDFSVQPNIIIKYDKVIGEFVKLN
ncbi:MULTISPECIES: hypothetical protein [Clostridium]|uniref:Uncharacterized protein n=1 Tax=Clostridium cibarium TaxID=2762247 RepID=A0ABR8PVP9_9CLOT|nr:MULTISPECIES: hypothetical protein [Clostridium]MBD7912204.1 hypothetical protein [Clostridium cibarium]